MSEGAAAVAAPASAPVTPGNAGQANASSQAQGNQGKSGQSQQSQGQQGKEANAAEELEEIKIGSASHKVPKSLAKTIKDLERGFHSKSQEAATAKAQNAKLESDFAKGFKENPRAMFAKYGVDANEFAEMTMAEKFELLNLTPEQRRMKEMEDRVKKYEETEKEAKERQENEQRSAEEAKEDQALRTQMFDAWKDSGLPSHPYFGQRIAAVMMAANNQQLGWTWQQAAARVKEDFGTNVREVLSNLPAEQVLALLGEDVPKKLREYDVNRVTGKSAPKIGSQSSNQRPGSRPASTKATGKALTEAEYREYFKRLQDS